MGVGFVSEPDAVFRHIGKVMWEREFAEGGIISCWLGVQFSETLGGDVRLKEWGRIISEKLDS